MKETPEPNSASTPRSSSPTVEKLDVNAKPAPPTESEPCSPRKHQESETYSRIRITSDGDAYVPLGSWARRGRDKEESNRTCTSAAPAKPKVASKPAPVATTKTEVRSVDDEDVVIVRNSQN